MKKYHRKHIISALGALGAIALGAAVSPAFAAPFTDVNGNTCDTSQLVGGGPGGQSVCPGGSAPPGMSLSQPQLPFPNKFFGPERVIGNPDFPGNEPNDPDYPDTPWSDLLDFATRTYGLGFRLGMYVNNPTGGVVDLNGGGYSLRNGGVSVSDTAGLAAPGAQSASYRQNSGDGGIAGKYDASWFVGANQHLWFTGAFNYTNTNANYGGVSAGSSINGDSYKFSGTGTYSNYSTYVSVRASYQFGDYSEFNSSDSSTGSYRSDGYEINATLGHIFWLFNTISQPATSRMAVKATPKPSDGYAIGLDLNGHLGYQRNVANSFTDSSGFVFGDERVQGGETGLRAKLFATVPNNGLVWTPYVTGMVDWRFNYSHVSNFPGQLAIATGDVVTFADATTFVGAQVGLDVKTTYGWTIGANGFYDRSSDTEVVGGKAYVKIPFGETAVSARY